MKKEININSIVKSLKKTKKIAWWIGAHVFHSVMITVIIGVILGYIFFHRSVISNDRLISQIEPVILFHKANYQETVRIWETNNTKRTKIAQKIYTNPFEERIDSPDKDIEESEIEKEDPIIDDKNFIIHTIVPGDNLWILAKRYLGSGFRWVEITDLDGNPYPDWRANILSINEQVRIPTR